MEICRVHIVFYWTCYHNWNDKVRWKILVNYSTKNSFSFFMSFQKYNLGNLKKGNLLSEYSHGARPGFVVNCWSRNACFHLREICSWHHLLLARSKVGAVDDAAMRQANNRLKDMPTEMPHSLLRRACRFRPTESWIKRTPAPTALQQVSRT